MATKELLFYLLSGDEDYVHMHAGVIHINPSTVPACIGQLVYGLDQLHGAAQLGELGMYA